MEVKECLGCGQPVSEAEAALTGYERLCERCLCEGPPDLGPEPYDVWRDLRRTA